MPCGPRERRSRPTQRWVTCKAVYVDSISHLCAYRIGVSRVGKATSFFGVDRTRSGSARCGWCRPRRSPPSLVPPPLGHRLPAVITAIPGVALDPGAAPSRAERTSGTAVLQVPTLVECGTRAVVHAAFRALFAGEQKLASRLLGGLSAACCWQAQALSGMPRCGLAHRPWLRPCWAKRRYAVGQAGTNTGGNCRLAQSGESAYVLAPWSRGYRPTVGHGPEDASCLSADTRPVSRVMASTGASSSGGSSRTRVFQVALEGEVCVDSKRRPPYGRQTTIRWLF